MILNYSFFTCCEVEVHIAIPLQLNCDFKSIHFFSTLELSKVVEFSSENGLKI